MDRRAAFLEQVLGTTGSRALLKAADKSSALEHVLLPRAVLAWLKFTGDFNGSLPGIPDSSVSFKKSDSGYDGIISIRRQPYAFNGASLEHVASSIIVAMEAETFPLPVQARFTDLARLGKSIDFLIGARVALHRESLRKAAPKGPVSGVPAAPSKQAPQVAPQGPEKAKAAPKPPEPQPKTAVPPAPKPKVVFPKIQLPGVAIKKSQLASRICGECGTRSVGPNGNIKGCMCIRGFFKSVDFEDRGESWNLTFGEDLDKDEIELVIESLTGGHRG